ncbi:MAG: PLP-dependent aminotransferase family protein [Anaerolineae bacterium]|nr:PLP-dependent aminotransferase family protein [Anaerolineae bacterium]
MDKTMLAFALNREGQEPLYNQLKRHLARQIENGILAPGDRLPATRDLAEQLGVARISVVAAYEELKVEGYITSQIGRGTFVAERSPGDLDVAPLVGAMSPRDATLRELLSLADRPNVINFSHGIPADSFLSVSLIREALDAVLTRDGASAIAYEAPEGYLPLRELVARRAANLGIDVTAGEVLITGGCQQALDLAVQALLKPGDVLLTSNPTYTGMLDIAQARGVTVLGVPVDAEGMQTADLEDLIVQHRPRLLYLAPTYHNPTGSVMPLHRRRHLLDLAGRYRLPVLEDGVYGELRYTGEPPPPLKALDEHGLVLYASSFSKVLLPGMRIGYLLAGGGLYQRLARVKRAADICTPALNQRAIHLALESGQLDEHVSQVRIACRQRRASMLDALSQDFPEACWAPPAGGMYLWLELPTGGPTSTELYLHAVRSGVAFAMGPLFYTDAQGRHHLRLNMSAYPPDTIQEGIKRLSAAWRELAAGYVSTDQASSVPFL